MLYAQYDSISCTSALESNSLIKLGFINASTMQADVGILLEMLIHETDFDFHDDQLITKQRLATSLTFRFSSDHRQSEPPQPTGHKEKGSREKCDLSLSLILTSNSW